MPIVRTGETDYDKEMAKWNRPKRDGGMNADGYEPFPKCLYKAIRSETGKVVCIDINPATLEPWSGTTLVVKSQVECDRALAQGWRESPPAAHEYYDRIEKEISTAAAEANYSAQRMSTKAQRERAAREAATLEHVPD